MRNYFSVHNHTEYSNLKLIDSINRADRMIDYAWEIGLSGLAFTDHDCVSGHLKFLKAYKSKLEKEWTKQFPDIDKPSYEEMSKQLDFKVALGNEIYLSEEGLDKDQLGHFYHMILVAKDAEGWKQIKQLSSAAWQRAWCKAILRTPTYPSDLFNIVKGGHLICTTACLGGYVAQQFLLQEYDKIDNHLALLDELFGHENFFIELQPNLDGEEQISYNKFMIEKYWGKYNFIFATDSHYLKPDEREIHKAFLNSKSSKDREVDEFYKYAYMMTSEEVKMFMPYVTEEQFNIMTENTRKIKDSISFFEIAQPKVIAKVDYEHWDEYENDLEVFNDVDAEKYPYFYQYLHSEDEADNYLIRLIAHGFIEKYKSTWNYEEYYKRLEEELWTIKTVGDSINQSMSDYFITMSKMVDLIWEAGSIVGPSRGSAGALLLNYLIGITQINPIELDLPYVWRFMHPSRPDFPDIDVDSESGKRSAVFNAIKKYFTERNGDVINVCTFGTEGTKSALKTAARGLKIDDDTIAYITSMIPNERCNDWSLKDCYYGNGENRSPIKAFVTEMNKYPKLWALSQNIEGLVTRLGVHASGVVCVNGSFIEYGSYMRTSKGQLVTAFDLHDQEECALIKYDMLTVSALDRIHQTMNYLLEDKVIEWQGSLKKTYNKYLAPEVLDYTSEEMWNIVGQNGISSLFQFDTIVGGQAIRQIQPRNLKQLAIANSIMRLMSDGEQPIDIYVEQKNNPQLWYDKMYNYGLTDEEIKVLEPYLKEKDGVAESQEVVMQLSMDKNISNFTMSEANKLRKVIAKKEFRDIEKIHDLYMTKGREVGTSDTLLNYVWEKQFSLSLGYSFSTIHTTGYSIIAVQEMNLAYHYPIIYWNCACLSVDSSAINAVDFHNLIEEEIIEEDDDEDKKVQNKMDYAKIAAALDSFKNVCQIQMPDINKSRLSFTPILEDNSILYGLKGISRITEPVINEIFLNRPFSSLKDFLNKVTKKIVTKDKVINLIKCGAFNKIENKTTEQILDDYIWSICEPKQKLTLQNANMLIDLNLLPVELETESELYKLTKELRKNKDDSKLWYFADRIEVPILKIDTWRQIIADSGIQGKELTFNGEPRKVLDLNAWDKYYKTKMENIKTYIKNNHDQLLTTLNELLFMNEFNKYCAGDELQWELDSMNFFFKNHPLNQVLPQLPFETDILDDIEEGAQDGVFSIQDKIIPKMRLYTIAGTVIDRDKTKSLVTLQTPTGVIDLKIYKDLYATFVNVIGEVSESGEKIIEQDSFFEKGVHLLVTGIKRGSTFVPKVYKSTGRKAILKINIDENGNFAGLEEKK
jgi:DNA polymerase-3 subunit alpha